MLQGTRLYLTQDSVDFASRLGKLTSSVTEVTIEVAVDDSDSIVVTA